MPMRSAAIYARISDDTEGLGKGVERQIADCRVLGEKLGWPVCDVYADNDVSAYSGRPRPEYERMLCDMEDGAVNCVLVYNLDRLTRQPREFERFYEAATRAGITDVRFVTGDMDFGTDDGLFIGRIQAAVAANESAAKSRRIKRKNDERAAAGIPHGGGDNRAYGFKDDWITHEPSEVRIVRRLASRYLAGQSLSSLATWLNSRGIPTVTGRPWTSARIGRILTAPRTAGLREHRGQIVGPGIWRPILKPVVRDRILALRQSRERAGRRVPRWYALSGVFRCSECGLPLSSAGRMQTLKTGERKEHRRYVCHVGPDHGGCGKVSLSAPPADAFVVDAVLTRLDAPKLAGAIAAGYEADEDNAPLIASLQADRDELEAVAQLFGEKQITLSEWLIVRDRIEARIRRLQRRLEQSGAHRDLARLIGQGAQIRRQWEHLDVGHQSAIVRAVVDHVIVSRGQKGSHRFDPRRLEIAWRL